MEPHFFQELIVPDGFSVSESGTYFGVACLTRTPLWVPAHTDYAMDGAGIEVSWVTASEQRSAVIAASLLHATNPTFTRVMRRLGITVESRPLKLRQYLFLAALSAPSKRVPHSVRFIRYGRVWRVDWAESLGLKSNWSI